MREISVHARPSASSEAEFALNGYLDRYSGGTRKLYEYDMSIWFGWCLKHGLDPLEAKRIHIEAFSRWLQSERKNSPRSTCRRLQTIRSFYKLAAADEIVPRDPTFMMQMPKWSIDPQSIRFATVTEMHRCLAAAREMSPSHEALIALMCYLGLRVSEACSVRIEDFSKHREGYTVLNYIRKGGKPTTAPIPVPLKKIIKRARAGRKVGPLIVTRGGNAQNRRGAYDWVQRITRSASVAPGLHPHSFRHGVAKMLLVSGLTLEEVQHFMGHADIRTTMHYARREFGLSQHGVHAASRILGQPNF